MGFGIDLLADLLEVEVHGPGIGLWYDPCRADTSGWADGPEKIGPGIALVAGLARSASALGPDPGQRALLADTRFILPPDFDGLVSGRFRDGRGDQIGEVFLCVSWADASCPGC